MPEPKAALQEDAAPLERLRRGAAPLVLYPLLALLSFPTLGLLLFGPNGMAYAHDVFDIVRSGVVGDWLANGPTLWNTHLTAGNALLAQQAIGPYAIDVPLAMVIGSFGAFVVNSWLLAAVAGIGMHLFLRDVMRLSTVAVFGGAIIYTLAFWHPIYGFVVPGLPLLLWLLNGAVRPSPVRWRFVAGRVAWIAFLLYNGQAQIAALVAILEFGWVLVSAGRDRMALRRGILTWLGTWLAGLGLYGPVLVTQFVILPISQRTVWVLADFWPPDVLGEAIALYSSALFGAVIAPAIGNSPAVYGTFFLGALGVSLVALAVIRPTRDPRRWFLIALLVAIPTADVLITSILPNLESIGFLKSLQLNRVRHLYPFALIAVSACGLDVLTGAIARGARPLVRGWRPVVVALAAVPAVVTLAVAARQVVTRRDELAELDPRALGWLAVAVALLAGLAAMLAVIVWARRRPSGAKLATRMLVGLLLVLVVERPVYAYAERLMGRNISTWHADVEATPGIRFLLEQPGIDLDRVLAFGEEPARLAAAGLQQADGYEVIYPIWYHGLFGALTAPELAEQPFFWKYFHHWGNRALSFGPRVDPQILALLGIRWLYVRGDAEPTVPGIVPRFRDGDVTVYEVPEPFPRAFVVDGVEQLDSDTAVLEALAAADADTLRERGFMTAANNAEALPTEGEPPADGSGTATIVEYTPDRVRIDTDGDGGVLVLTDTWAPGWQAAVDGVPTPIHRVDGAFRGVAVKSGAHEIVFRYVPEFTYAGFGLALITLVATTVAVVILRRHDRQPASSP